MASSVDNSCSDEIRLLVRNCAHGSSTHVVEIVGGDGSLRSIRKSSAVAGGLDDLRREVAGVRWYNERCGERLVLSVEREDARYMAIRYEALKGSKANYHFGYYHNRSAISSVIAHYCDVWGAGDGTRAVGDRAPLHGDLSLDNVIFVDTEPVILDWEHFDVGGAPLGFDALYLLFECLWFEQRWIGVRRRSITHIAKMIGILRSRGCVDSTLLDHPLRAIVEFIRSHSQLWGPQLVAFPAKLPVLLLESDVVAKIDTEVRRFGAMPIDG